jgi:natural product biosynthesis luciferase-like monooxygenase protein
MTNQSLAERIAALSPEKKALLDRRLGGRPVGPAAPPPGDSPAACRASDDQERPKRDGGGRRLDFSLLFFSGDGATSRPDKYHLLTECVKHADANDYVAVWTPERHFKPFGGLYPNPAVIAAALSMVTTRVEIRAGSVVLPLNDPLRVAEEWAVVDNLSGGRVALAFASGWLADDFVLAPDRYAGRKKVMFEGIDTVSRLWRGEAVRLPNGKGEDIAVRIYPNPIQLAPPIWITATHKETFVEAGRIGANILTGLMETNLDQCGDCIAAYRRARADNGMNPADGRVAVMLHTFVGQDLGEVTEKVRGPFQEYLRSYLQMTKPQAGSDNEAAKPGGFVDDEQTLIELAFERYFRSGALFGTPESCERMIDRLRAIDVDEVACLLDFGLADEDVLNGLSHLTRLKDMVNCTSLAQPVSAE